MRAKIMLTAVLAALLLTALQPRFPARAADETLFIDFEDGTVMGFDTRGTEEEKAAGTGVLTVVTEEARGGYSLLITDRTDAWNGPSINVTSHVVSGAFHDISVWVHAKTPDTSIFRLSTQVGQGGSAEYHNILIKSISVSDGWTELTGRFMYSGDDYITVYVENNSSDAEYYIDDVYFSADAGGDGIQDSIQLPSLYERYREYFLLGSAYNRQDLSGQRFELIKRHFNVMTAANAMKPDTLGGRSRGEYNLDNADAMLDVLGEAGILVHGHALVWHSQSAAWLNHNDDGTVMTRAEARASMEDFISTVAGHYAGRVISWDVVNEAFQNSVHGNPSDWRDALRKGEAPWYMAYENGADSDAGESGADYIYDAFVFARLADPNAVLYYNDFNETEREKREAIAKMAEELNEKWKADTRNNEPERLLIEGLGMQAHYWTDNLEPRDVEDTILRWAATGAEISITELDIPAGDYSQFKTLDWAEERKQAILYAQLFRIFKKHSDSIARVTVWGIDDPTSWRSGGSPLLFGDGTVAKQTFYAVLDPEGFFAGEYDHIGLPDAPPEEEEPASPPEAAAPPEEEPASQPEPPAADSEKDGPALYTIIGAALGLAGAVILIVTVRRLKLRGKK